MTTTTVPAGIDFSDPAAVYALYKAAREANKEVEALRVKNLSEENSAALTAFADVTPLRASNTGSAWVGGEVRGLTGVNSDGEEFTYTVTVTHKARTSARNAIVDAVTKTFPSGTKKSDEKLKAALISALAAHEQAQGNPDPSDDDDE